MYYKLIIALLAVGITGLQGCATARGLGQDLENLGLVIQGKKINRQQTVATEVVVEGTSTTISEVVVESPAVTTPAGGGMEQVQTYPYSGGTVRKQSQPATERMPGTGATAF